MQVKYNPHIFAFWLISSQRDSLLLVLQLHILSYIGDGPQLDDFSTYIISNLPRKASLQLARCGLMMPLTSLVQEDAYYDFSPFLSPSSSTFFQTLLSSIQLTIYTGISVLIIILIIYMFSLHLSEKKERESHQRKRQENREKQWMKKYHSQIKPKMIERYDARVNAFIRQLQEAPTDRSKVLQHHQSVHFKPFKFTNNSPRNHPHPQSSKKNDLVHTSLNDINSGIRRSSQYVPLSNYQFRTRQKDKEIRPKLQLKILKYRKWQKQAQQITKSDKPKEKEDGQLSRLSARQFFRKIPQDNRSQIPSVYDDNQSLRFSVNDNIEGQARAYEKQQELMQRKQHFKRLANLQQVLHDPRAKKSIHQLLVKSGFTKPKIKTEKEEAEIDLLKLELEKEGKYL